MRVVWSAMKFRGRCRTGSGIHGAVAGRWRAVRVCASSNEPVTTRLSGVGVPQAPVRASR